MAIKIPILVDRTFKPTQTSTLPGNKVSQRPSQIRYISTHWVSSASTALRRGCRKREKNGVENILTESKESRNRDQYMGYH